MTKVNQKKIPKFWLTPEGCERAFNLFYKLISFDQPIPPFNRRYRGELESILGSVRQTYDKKLLNKDVIVAGAALFNQLIRGHPFINGNKRLATLYLDIFLYANGVSLTLSWQAVKELAVLVAKAAEDQISAEETKRIIIKILREHSSDVEVND